jgi:hypothetical protein
MEFGRKGILSYSLHLAGDVLLDVVLKMFVNTFSAKVRVHSYLASSTFSAKVRVHSYSKPNSNWWISLYLDTVHSVLPARTVRGQLFRCYFADIVRFLNIQYGLPLKLVCFWINIASTNQYKKISGKYLYSLYFFFTAEYPSNTGI